MLHEEIYHRFRIIPALPVLIAGFVFALISAGTREAALQLGNVYKFIRGA